MAQEHYNNEADILAKTLRSDSNSEVEVSNSLVIDLALVKQGLDARSTENGKQAILDTIRRIKMLQIDTVNVVERSHYLVLLSRLGIYEKRYLDELQFPDRMLFEQRSHANCLIPIEFYPLYQPEIVEGRKIRESKLKKLGADPNALLASVLKEIRERGPLSSADFESDAGRKRGWWNRKPEKEALEILWKRGNLAVAMRSNFRSYYDLPERVIPSDLLKERHSLQDFRRWAAISGLDALGIGTVEDVADYYRQKPAETKVMLEQLVAEGAVTKINVKDWDEGAYALSKDLKLIAGLKDKPLATSGTALLSPFDNLIWFRDRTERLFGLHFRIEMYVPKSERNYGYYLMPILHDKRIIGKIDPKADRKSKTLEVNNIHLEKGVEADKNLVTQLSKSLREFAQFNDCNFVKVHKTTPVGLKDRLEKETCPTTKTKAKV
jgi:hypothetical protein